MLIGLIHGACLVFIDALNVEESNQFNPYQTCLQYLFQTSQQFITNQLNIQQLFESNLYQIENEAKMGSVHHSKR